MDEKLISSIVELENALRDMKDNCPAGKLPTLVQRVIEQADQVVDDLRNPKEDG